MHRGIIIIIGKGMGKGVREGGDWPLVTGAIDEKRDSVEGGGTSQQPGGRLMISDHFLHDKDN